jgi:translocator protein
VTGGEGFATEQEDLHPVHQLWKERVFQVSDPNEWGARPGSSPPVPPGLALVGFVGLCLLVGGANLAVTSDHARGWYWSLSRPLGTPPDWMIAAVWGVLYPLIGTAAWLVWRRVGAGQRLALWGWQLGVQAAWTPVFFALHSPRAAVVVFVVLLPLIVLTIRRFAEIHRIAARMMVPYLLWSLYALYLNLGFCYLNPG